MSEFKTGVAELKANGTHLAIELVEMGMPSKNTVAKINAEINEDLLGNNKFSQGKKEFLPVNVFRRILNDAFDCKWSWEISQTLLMPTHDAPEYAMVVGRLYLPGLGFRDGIGTAKMDKKDNSAAFATATSNAFKNALKQSGFGASLLDDNWEDDLFEEDFDEEDEEEVAPPPKKAPAKKEAPKEDAPKKQKKEAPKEEAPAKKKAKSDITDDQKAQMAELRELYNITDNNELLGFMQIWKPELKLADLGSLTKASLDEFLKHYDDNEDEYEDFDPEEVA